MATFDPNAAARPGSGIFGLPHSEDEAELVVVPVPFDATTSYRAGSRDGPPAVRRASHQIDLFDLQTGRCYERGIHMAAEDPRIRELSATARRGAEPLIAAGGARLEEPADLAAVQEVDRAGAELNEIVGAEVRERIGRGKRVGVLGGDHSVPFGAIRVLAERHPGLGILHVDAHADLRRAFEGFRWSHASIMDNVVRELDGVARIAQVGVRDLCEEEMSAIRRSEGRVRTWTDLDWRRRLAAGEPFVALCDEVVRSLPEDVYVSLDIDGLDPALCPNTGTPVPGGLSFQELCLLLEALPRAGRRIVGFDLCEVAPGPTAALAAGEGDAGGASGGHDSWDAVVGARVLYKLCGFCLLTS